MKGLSERFFAALLRNKILSSDRLGEEGEAQACGGALEVLNRSVPEVLFIRLLTLGLIRGAMFEDMVKNPCQLVRGGRNRLRRPFAGAHAPIITAQGGLGAPQGLGRQAQGLRRAAVAFEGLAAQHLAPRDVVVGCQAQPRGKLLLGGPLAHIRADFRQEDLGTAGLQALHGRQIKAQNPIQAGPHVEGRRILGMGVGLGIRPQGRRGRLLLIGGLDGGIVLLEVGVTFLHLRGVEVIERQRLLEGKDVFGTIVPTERLDNLRLTALAAPVAQARQDLRVPLPGHDRPDDLPLPSCR